jgi:hypothetical protein
MTVTNGTLLLDVDFITDNLTGDAGGSGSTNTTASEGAETGIVNWFLHILVAFILAILILVTAIGKSSSFFFFLFRLLYIILLQ